MDRKYKVSFRGDKPLEFEEGTTYKEISEHFKDSFKYDILVARVDNTLIYCNVKADYEKEAKDLIKDLGY